MEVSSDGVFFIKQWEFLSLDAYQDIAGVWTVGYGRTRNVRKGLMITQAVADQMFSNDAKAFGSGVNAVCGKKTNQHQFDAMVSLAYNIGIPGFMTSTVLRQHLLARYPDAGAAFLLWDMAHIDGQLEEVTGLLDRREAERELYLS